MPDKGGRPVSAEKQVARVEKIARHIKEAVGSGLFELVESYPDLVRDSIDTARDTSVPAGLRQKERHFLMKHVTDFVKIDQDDGNPLKDMFNSWKVENVQINVAGESEESAEPAEHRVVEGAARSLDESEPDQGGSRGRA